MYAQWVNVPNFGEGRIRRSDLWKTLSSRGNVGKKKVISLNLDNILHSLLKVIVVS